MQRRDFCRRLGVALAGVALAPAAPAAENNPLKIGLTPVFLDDQASFLQDWQLYLEHQLQRPVAFVQRGSYREIIDLILQDNIQFSWLCGFPFVRNRERMRLLAVPVYRGQPLYQSYLIVPAGDTYTQTLLELRDRVFAYSDPDSNSGFLHPQFQLISAGIRPDGHFRRSFFTYGHRNVVDAVASRVAHGGAVDGYVWDRLQRTHPELVRRTRVAERSPKFGFPPLVAAPGVSASTVKRMQGVLLAMHQQAAGKALLYRLGLDRFDAGTPQLFDSIERMARTVRAGRA